MQPATVRLLPWAPQYGTSMLADPDSPAPRVEVDTAVEQGRWAAVAPATAALTSIQVVLPSAHPLLVLTRGVQASLNADTVPLPRISTSDPA